MARLDHPPVEVQDWEGQSIYRPPLPARITIRVKDRLTLWRVLLEPLYQFAEGYAHGRIEIDGELVEFFSIVFGPLESPKTLSWVDGLSSWLRRRRHNTLRSSRQNIHHHYDLGNDFYERWLDRQMVYTCAYFEHPADSLEQAQTAKFDHVCRKLQLRPGERVIEAGCGWGALSLHMARHYGVSVRAWNISRQQVAYARARARREGLEQQVEFVEDDWRNIVGPCEAFVSVGMLEHVGPGNYAQLGRVIDRCLVPGGRGLIHTIGQNQPKLMDSWIERRIFPGACPPTLRQMMSIFQPCDFSVLDVENLRPHYAKTIRHWLARFEESAQDIQRMFDPAFVRMWRLYLSGSIAAFDVGTLQLFQVVFAKGIWKQSPWTRVGLYATHRAGDAQTGLVDERPNSETVDLSRVPPASANGD